jgi:peptidoglycan/LPS O-acetylase OafA/YrhL
VKDPEHLARRETLEPEHRFQVLDGWRAASILFVLAGHQLPLGPKTWQLNAAIAATGLAMFFALSGFLIMKTLLDHQNVIDFLIRRIIRIAPLYFVYITISGILTGQSKDFFRIFYLYIENYHMNVIPRDLTSYELFTHLWSICVEMHFYLGIALWMALSRFRGSWIIPVLLVMITVAKLLNGSLTLPQSSMTHWRVDEILAGATAALIFRGILPARMTHYLAWLPVPVVFIALVLSCHPLLDPFGGVLRPYLLLACIVSVIVHGQEPRFALLRSAPANYIAQISYALYVLHQLPTVGWLGSGETKFIVYMKRPLSFFLAFFGAHVSTFFFELRMNRWGKSIIAWRHRAPVTSGPYTAEARAKRQGYPGFGFANRAPPFSTEEAASIDRSRRPQ